MRALNNDILHIFIINHFMIKNTNKTIFNNLNLVTNTGKKNPNAFKIFLNYFVCFFFNSIITRFW